MTSPKPFYLTTPIYYVNGPPHFAHAYTTVSCDVLARFHRLDGRMVHFVTGTDEHGQKVAQAAGRQNLEPLAFCDAVSAEFRAMNDLMNISHDDFIRTTEPRHINACQTLWRTLEQNGQIYRGTFSGWYSVRDEAYFDADELVDGRAPTGAPVEWVQEENFFFRLSEWGERLLAFYDANPDFIAPASRRNEVVSFVRSGLRDLSISRTSFDWGIPVPDAPGHVMYVWLDALTNYLTAAGYPDRHQEMGLWPADLHVVGKDIVRFHCVYWPAFLLAADLRPPSRVFAHGWWTIEGEKMSKSLDNFVPPGHLVDRFGVDGVRYFMTRELSFGADGDLSNEALYRRVTGELANEFGNLAHRTLTMIARYFDGIVPTPVQFAHQDIALHDAAADLLPVLRVHMQMQEIQMATSEIWNLVSAANRYVQAESPWTTAKEGNIARLAQVLYTLAETLRKLALVLQPIIPEAAGKLLDSLAVQPSGRDFASYDTPIAPGIRLPAPKVLFPRRDPLPDLVGVT